MVASFRTRQLSHDSRNLASQPLVSAALAFPHDNDFPSHAAKPAIGPLITQAIATKLWYPIISIALRLSPLTALTAPVPKTPSHLNDRLESRKYNVGSARQSSIVKHEPKPEAMECTSYATFWESVFGRYLAHHL